MAELIFVGGILDALRSIKSAKSEKEKKEIEARIRRINAQVDDTPTLHRHGVGGASGSGTSV